MKRAFGIVAVSVLVTAAFATAASATSVTRVTLVVHETLAGGGAILETTVPGCAAGDPVATLEPQARLLGQNRMFTGFKQVDCGAAGTFTFAFQAVAKACSPRDVGTWKIVGGTGSFAGVTGGGNLIGTYFPAGACPPPRHRRRLEWRPDLPVGPHRSGYRRLSRCLRSLAG